MNHEIAVQLVYWTVFGRFSSPNYSFQVLSQQDSKQDFNNITPNILQFFFLLGHSDRNVMNEWCIYIALYCVSLYTQSTLQSCGGVSPQPPPVCSIHLDDATAATGQRRQCAHHTPAAGGERVIEPIKWMGIVRRPWLTRASGGNLARTPGYTPNLYEKYHGIFNDHRESGSRV